MQNQELKELKEKLPLGAYKLISEKLDGKYTPGTIGKMFNGNRKINPVVVQVAIEIIEFNSQKHIDNENK